MTVGSEVVTSVGSGLTFVNTYDPEVTEAYRGEILAAEHALQSHFSDAVTLNVTFGLKDLDPSFIAQNTASSFVLVSYAQFAQALSAHATTADDQLAIAGLPLTDPTHGQGFDLPAPYAAALGLTGQAGSLTVLLGEAVPTFTKEAIGAIEHEITESGFGREGSLGLFSPGLWWPLDLFRFSADGVRDFTGGRDGVPTFFGVDAAHVTSVAFHNSIGMAGVNDGFDFGDWNGALGDAFGPAGPALPGTLSAVDLQVLDILGFTPIAPSAAPASGPDDFASSFSDTSHPIGPLAVGGSVAGTLEAAGDHDWFVMQLHMGDLYTVSVSGQASGAGTLADPLLRLHDNNGITVAAADDLIPNGDTDAQLTFIAARTGTYYLDAGAYDDAGAGSYRASVTLVAASTGPAGPDDDALAASAGNPEIHAGPGNDTIIGAPVQDYLRGDDGDDFIYGGPAFDDANGNKGADTIHGNGGDDFSVGGQGDDLLFGDDGSDVVWGNLGDDTCDGGAGNDQCRGGQGDDSVSGGAGDDFISGDRGNDTEAGGAGADTFNTFAGAGIDRVLDFNAAEGDRVVLEDHAAFTVTQVGADTVIDLGNGDQMILVGVSMASLTGNWIVG